MIWDADPIAFSVFGLAVRWYGLAYLFGFFLASGWGFKIHQRITKTPLKKEDFQNFVFYVFLFGVIGGRLGEFLFYNPSVFIQDPLEVFKIWNGGMSIHGGILGAVLCIWYWSQKYKIPFLTLSDSIVIPLAVTLIFGRLANFMNGELVGIPTGTDWGVIFPRVDNLLRHPTQLYESAKSLVLSGILFGLYAKNYGHIKGILTGTFFVGYGVMRFVIEFWKQGEMIGFFNTGQWLSLAMVVIGVYLLTVNRKQES